MIYFCKNFVFHKNKNFILLPTYLLEKKNYKQKSISILLFFIQFSIDNMNYSINFYYTIRIIFLSEFLLHDRMKTKR